MLKCRFSMLLLASVRGRRAAEGEGAGVVNRRWVELVLQVFAVKRTALDCQHRSYFKSQTVPRLRLVSSQGRSF